MLLFIDRCYVEVKDKRHSFHPFCDVIQRERNPTEILRTQYQVQNKTKIRKNQKVIRNQNRKSEIERYPTKKI